MQCMDLAQQTMQMMFQDQSDDMYNDLYVMELYEGSNVDSIG